MLFSNPQHGEIIDNDGMATRPFNGFMIDVSELYSLDSLPDENEKIFNNGRAELQLSTFLQDAALAAGLTAPVEGEKILINGSALFAFQAFLDDLAA